MRASKIMTATAGIAAIALATLLVASPASAAILPDGQKLTTVVQFLDDPDVTQMFNTSPADAASDAIGAADGPFILEGIDVNDDGHGYAVQTELGIVTNEPILWVADANTGVFSDPVPILPTVDITITSCAGIDLQPNGEILIACFNYQNTDFVQNSYIGVVTPAGDFTPFVTDGVNSAPLVAFDALAYDAVNGELWAFGSVFDVEDGFTPNSYVVDRAAGTLSAPIPMDEPMLSADFDRGGQLFVMYSPGESLPVLGTAIASDGSIVEIGVPTTGGDEITARALTVWGKPGLPATGPAEILPIGLGTALLFLAGAAFVATSRIQRRAA
jgi:hypothetical protein